MIKYVYKKQTKSPFTIILYFVLMALSFFLLECSTYNVLRVSGYSTWLRYGSQGLFGLTMLLWGSVWLSDPGELKKNTSHDLGTLLDIYEATSICADCKVIKTPRSRHCNLCDICVDRFDHHCPWVNNCIGKGNYARFYSFVFTQSLYLLSVSIVSILYYKLEFVDDVYSGLEDRNLHPWHKYRRATGVILSFVAVFFLVCVVILCWVQTCNLMRGESTSERFDGGYKATHALSV